MTQLLHANLHWLDVPEHVKCELCMMMCRCQDGTVPRYLAVHWAPVSKIASQQYLCFAASHQLTVLPHRWITMVVGHLLSLARRHRTYCQNLYVTPPLVLLVLFLAIFSKHSFSQSTSVSSALEALAKICHINLHFTLRYTRYTESVQGQRSKVKVTA